VDTQKKCKCGNKEFWFNDLPSKREITCSKCSEVTNNELFLDYKIISACCKSEVYRRRVCEKCKHYCNFTMELKDTKN
jgi:hypothetical protein